MSFNFSTAKLTVNDVAELNNANTLYIVDFRATGESLSHEIDSMFIYENLSQWLLRTSPISSNGYYAVNSAQLQRGDLGSTALVAPPAAQPSASVIARLPHHPAAVHSLWAGIPHPAIDTYAHANNLTVNYTYPNFLHYNNKLAQKHALGSLSPDYFAITAQADLDRALSMQHGGFIKSAIGAGGFSVYNIATSAATIRSNAQRIIHGEHAWYYEAHASGTPHSVQIYKQGSHYTLFGYAKQHIEGTQYTGARLLPIDALPVSVATAAEATCKQMDEFLSGYNGFFGIDIMVDGSAVTVLELNVRLTATTIPTLLANAMGAHTAVDYLEEISTTTLKSDDILLAQSPTKRESCVLRVYREQAV